MRTYVTFSFYATSDAVLKKLRLKLVAQPSRTTRRENSLAVHYSTRDVISSGSTHEHILFLKEQFCDLENALAEISGLESNVRLMLWIFVGMDQENQGFDIPVEALAWLARLRCEVAVDIWNVPVPPREFEPG